MAKSQIPFVDLFCGAGGLSVGFEQGGFQAVFANDNDPFACETYSVNHQAAQVYNGDIETLTGRSVLEATGLSSIPLVVGGPNCQGVSLRGKRNPDDPKNKMFFHFRRLVGELKPDWFVMENVPGLLHRHNRQLIRTIFEAFDDVGYRCGGEVLAAADYGVPQLRYRFMMIGSRTGEPILFPSSIHRAVVDGVPFRCDHEDKRPLWHTVRDGIGDLPAISNGGGSESVQRSSSRKLTAYQKRCRGRSRILRNHVCHLTSDHNISLIKHIPPGRNWKSIPERLRPERFRHVALKDHTTTYGRLSWDMPSRTVTAYFNNISAGAFTHPEQHRGISVREGARLQSFPDSFQFRGPLAQQYRQVGNAVPCLMAYHLAKGLMAQYEGGSTNGLFHPASVEFDHHTGDIRITRPLQGMRFNLDKHLVRG